MVSVVMEDGSIRSESANNIEIPTQMRLYSVWLFWAAHQKIQAIKAIRAATGMGLKEAKDHVEKNSNAPVLVKDHLTLTDAEELKRQIVADSGMEIEVRRHV
jgi:large subunit ribosomal protein L7/L12